MTRTGRSPRGSRARPATHGQYAVADVGRRVESVDADIVQQRTGTDQIGVGIQPGEELRSHRTHQLAVLVHRIERGAVRRDVSMQRPDLGVGRDLHQPVRWSWRTGPNRSISVARSTEATGSSPTRYRAIATPIS